MPNEIFPNPTVKQVIFQINFQTLFYLENRIGELQSLIMKKFPKSSLLNRQQVIFTDLGPEEKPIIPQNEESRRTIWRFESEDQKIQLNILNNSLDITSSFHKTYDSNENDNFRDVIKFVLDIFFEITNIPLISRMGLRYVDECPVFSNDNESFLKYYKSAFPIGTRFDLKDSEGMNFNALVNRGEYKLIYQELLQKDENDSYKFIMDFDGFAENINAEGYLNICDDLHKIISVEFLENSITEEFKEYMRNE